MKSISVDVRLVSDELNEPPEKYFFLNHAVEQDATFVDMLHTALDDLGLSLRDVDVRSSNVRCSQGEPWRNVWYGESVIDNATYDLILGFTSKDLLNVRARRTSRNDSERMSASSGIADTMMSLGGKIVRAGSKLLHTGIERASNALDMSHSGRDVQIVEISTTLGGQTRLVCKVNELAQILFGDNRTVDLPVCVVSVAGACRSGKSFLLNFFVRYLEHTELAQAGVLPRDVDWFLPTPQDNEPTQYDFMWKPGRHGVTKGIRVWYRPFIQSRANGDQFAVLLMDTQGTEDVRCKDEDFISIFALSTMLSSSQIYNFNHDYATHKIGLDRLHMFTEFARKAMQLHGDVHGQSQYFQSMTFLVRDARGGYGFDSDGELVDLLRYGGMAGSTQADADVLDCFDKVQGFSMPTPGESIHEGFEGSNPTYKTIVDAMTPKFRQFLQEFTNTVLDPERLPIKMVGGRAVTCGSLLQYFKEYCKVFQDGQLPQSSRLVEATSRLANKHAVELAKEVYVTQMYKNEYDAFQSRNVDHAIPIARDVYIKKWEDVVNDDKNDASRNVMFPDEEGHYLFYTRERMDAIQREAFSASVEEFNTFVHGFPSHKCEGLKRLEHQTKIAFTKRKTKNAVNYYVHRMSLAKSRASVWTSESLESNHKKCKHSALELADISGSDDCDRLFLWDLKQRLKIEKSMFLPLGMPRDNGIAYNVAIGYYVQEMRKSVVLYETRYVDRDEFNRMADGIRDDAKKLFAEHCAKDYATDTFEDRLLAEIHVQRERMKFEKINRKNLWMDYLKKAGAFFGSMIRNLVPWLRTSSAAAEATTASATSRDLPGGSGLLQLTDSGPVITELP